MHRDADEHMKEKKRRAKRSREKPRQLEKVKEEQNAENKHKGKSVRRV